VLPPPPVHPDLAPPAALAVADEQRAAARVDFVLGERERLVNAQAAAPEHDDHRAQPPPVAVRAREAHNRDDLLDRRRVRGVAHALVARRPAGVIAGHGRRRTTPTGGIDQDGHGHGSSSHEKRIDPRLDYQPDRVRA
jgi:hypothetical protein